MKRRNRRPRTISNIYYDDEILYVDYSNGDIHLKMGVKRKDFSIFDLDYITMDNNTDVNSIEGSLNKIINEDIHE
jgi:hypothetical protein